MTNKTKFKLLFTKIECSLLVLVDRLKRCRVFSLVKTRSDQWCGSRPGKCHSFLKIQIKISRLKAFTWVEMSEIPFTGLCYLWVGRKQENIKTSCWALIGICRRRQFDCSGVTRVPHEIKEFDGWLDIPQKRLVSPQLHHNARLAISWGRSENIKGFYVLLAVRVISKKSTALEK